MTAQIYRTTDLYRATAIIIKTGKHPDRFEKIVFSENYKPKIELIWENLDIDIINKLERRELIVEPIQFGSIHAPLKGKILEMAKEGI